MWYENLEQTEFLKQLYIDIPDIDCINIFDFRLSDNGKKLSISFVLEESLDYIPPKWRVNSFKYPIIQLDFFEISNAELLLYDCLEDMKLKIYKECSQKIVVEGIGRAKFKVISEIGVIQKIEEKR